MKARSVAGDLVTSRVDAQAHYRMVVRSRSEEDVCLN